MHFSLIGLARLPKHLRVEHREYTIINEKYEGRAQIFFTSPKGAKVQINCEPVDNRNDEIAGAFRVLIDDRTVVAEHDRREYFRETTELPNETLRSLVEQALGDLTAAELERDPSNRHTNARNETAKRARKAAEIAALLEKL
jgi:hypothetical protein